MEKSQPKELVLVRWTCSVPEHNHMTEELGNRCIQKMKNPPQKAKLLRAKDKERRVAICAMFELYKMPRKLIAEKMKISPGRVGQIISQEQHFRKYHYERL